MLLILLSLLPLSSGLFNYFGGSQTIAATGWLTCNGAPATDVKVKLYDVNTFYLDHFLDEKQTNATGGYYVQGTENSITTIAPKLNFYHKCNYNGLCYQKLAINIPQQYISTNSMYSNVFYAGVIELSGSFSGQSIDCLNRK